MQSKAKAIAKRAARKNEKITKAELTRRVNQSQRDSKSRAKPKAGAGKAGGNMFSFAYPPQVDNSVSQSNIIPITPAVPIEKRALTVNFTCTSQPGGKMLIKNDWTGQPAEVSNISRDLRLWFSGGVVYARGDDDKKSAILNMDVLAANLAAYKSKGASIFTEPVYRISKTTISCPNSEVTVYDMAGDEPAQMYFGSAKTTKNSGSLSTRNTSITPMLAFGEAIKITDTGSFQLSLPGQVVSTGSAPQWFSSVKCKLTFLLDIAYTNPSPRPPDKVYLDYRPSAKTMVAIVQRIFEQGGRIYLEVASGSEVHDTGGTVLLHDEAVEGYAYTSVKLAPGLTSSQQVIKTYYVCMVGDSTELYSSLLHQRVIFQVGGVAPDTDQGFDKNVAIRDVSIAATSLGSVAALGGIVYAGKSFLSERAAAHETRMAQIALDSNLANQIHANRLNDMSALTSSHAREAQNMGFASGTESEDYNLPATTSLMEPAPETVGSRLHTESLKGIPTGNTHARARHFQKGSDNIDFEETSERTRLLEGKHEAAPSEPASSIVPPQPVAGLEEHQLPDNVSTVGGEQARQGISHVESKVINDASAQACEPVGAVMENEAVLAERASASFGAEAATLSEDAALLVGVGTTVGLAVLGAVLVTAVAAAAFHALSVPNPAKEGWKKGVRVHSRRQRNKEHHTKVPHHHIRIVQNDQGSYTLQLNGQDVTKAEIQNALFVLGIGPPTLAFARKVERAFSSPEGSIHPCANFDRAVFHRRSDKKCFEVPLTTYNMEFNPSEFSFDLLGNIPKIPEAAIDKCVVAALVYVRPRDFDPGFFNKRVQPKVQPQAQILKFLQSKYSGGVFNEDEYTPADQFLFDVTDNVRNYLRVNCQHPRYLYLRTDLTSLNPSVLGAADGNKSYGFTLLLVNPLDITDNMGPEMRGFDRRVLRRDRFVGSGTEISLDSSSDLSLPHFSGASTHSLFGT